MIGKKTLESKPIPAAKVKEILEEFSEKHELSYEQNLTLDHATNLNKLSLASVCFSISLARATACILSPSGNCNPTFLTFKEFIFFITLLSSISYNAILSTNNEK